MEKLGRFVMEEGETPKEMYNRLICIVNEIKGLGSKEMTDNFVVKRMLRAIAPRNPTLVTIIREQVDFAKLTPHDVLGREWDSNDSSTDSDDEDVHMCLTAIGSKVSSTPKSCNVDEFGNSDSDSND
uniref:Uncharacterized protein n=1 Tax=Setaria italica TaxID=4555 RepID=K3YXS9_SETIT